MKDKKSKRLDYQLILDRNGKAKFFLDHDGINIYSIEGKPVAFIEKEAPGVDVFVDLDLQRVVAEADDADVGDLKKLLSWRRMHALHGLVQADYTAVFLEPDVVFTKNPLQLFHDMLLDADVVASADYGVGAEALERVNTKVLFAKPSEEAKKLVDVWQRAEAAYQGDDSERGFLTKQILPNADRMEAAA